MIKLLVIENHETIIVSGLRQLFRPQRDGIEVTESISSVSGALAQCDFSRFDLILLDLWIPGEKPLENVKRLKQKFPGTPIMIYSSEDSHEWIRKMAFAGVRGYVVKDAPRTEIKDAILKVASGNTWFTGLSLNADEGPIHREFPNTNENLSLIQKEMLMLLAQGQTLKEIAEKLGTNANQVEKVLVRLRAKFKVKSNVELIRMLTEMAMI